jgi:hypothetical protein
MDMLCLALFAPLFPLPHVDPPMFHKCADEFMGVCFPSSSGRNLGIGELADVAIHGVIHGPKPQKPQVAGHMRALAM